MSIEAVQQFWQKAQSDQALQAQLQSLSSGSKEENLAAIVRIAVAAGFVFTVEEYEALLKKVVREQHAAGQLSEAELERVAGGQFVRGIMCRGYDS